MDFHIQINKDGKLPKQAIEDMQIEFKTLSGKKATVTIEKFWKKRSNLQMGWYWGVAVKLISEHTGYFPYQVHEILKAHLLGTHTATIGNVKVEVPNTTKELSTTDMMGYANQIQAFASSEIEVTIPDPDPNYKDKEYSEK